MKYLQSLFVVLLGTWVSLAGARAQDASILNPSGLPVPRFVSLKSAEVNMRVGPGERYPIRWVYQRASYPVEIIEEFAHWRKVRDFEGTSGWVHKNLLTGSRSALVLDKRQNLYVVPDATSRVIMRAEAMVVGKVMQCLPVRRNVEVSDEVLDSPHSLVQQQGGNRVWAAQAVLKSILSSGA